MIFHSLEMCSSINRKVASLRYLSERIVLRFHLATSHFWFTLFRPVPCILPRLPSVVNVLRALRALCHGEETSRERECERGLAFVFCERIHHRTHLLLLRHAFLCLYSHIVECKQRDSGNQLSLVRYNRERENGSYLRRNCGTSATVWMSHLFARNYIK